MRLQGFVVQCVSPAQLPVPPVHILYCLQNILQKDRELCSQAWCRGCLFLRTGVERESRLSMKLIESLVSESRLEKCDGFPSQSKLRFFGKPLPTKNFEFHGEELRFRCLDRRSVLASFPAESIRRQRL